MAQFCWGPGKLHHPGKRPILKTRFASEIGSCKALCSAKPQEMKMQHCTHFLPIQHPLLLNLESSCCRPLFWNGEVGVQMCLLYFPGDENKICQIQNPENKCSRAINQKLVCFCCESHYCMLGMLPPINKYSPQYKYKY